MLRGDARDHSTEVLQRPRREREENRVHLSVPRLMVQVERLESFVLLREPKRVQVPVGTLLRTEHENLSQGKRQPD